MAEENNDLHPEEGKVRRKEFLKAAAMVGGALAVSVGSVALLNSRSKGKPSPAVTNIPEGAPIDVGGENEIIRMQEELKKAMKKPFEERRWVMIIDLRKCTGCGACTVSCIAENHLPAGVVYRPVMEKEIGSYPNVTLQSIPRPCMQCESAPCAAVCPVKATWIRKDGIVEMDYDQCIGCRYCMTACPYHARTFDFGYSYSDGTPAKQPYEEVSSFEYDKRWVQKKGSSPVGNVRKCHFCTHKLNAGMLPSCVTTCIGDATYFGDASDSENLVSELLAKSNKIRLKEEMGTKPRVYYLI
jgi:Fe-S-cluster-containing dehydrogenase component